MSPRFALYYAPPVATPLWRFGSEALGYDAETGRDMPLEPIPGLSPQRRAELAAGPARYGFHATLKPPFRLAEGRTGAGLVDALERFASGRPPVALPALDVAVLGGFVALTIPAPSDAVQALADACVAHFDPWRAPMDTAERARRIGDGLGAREIANLDRWGYPHVFDRFRFHMTLSGDAAPGEREGLAGAFRARLGTAGHGVTIGEITLFEQPSPAERFRIRRRVPLAG